MLRFERTLHAFPFQLEHVYSLPRAVKFVGAVCDGSVDCVEAFHQAGHGWPDEPLVAGTVDTSSPVYQAAKGVGAAMFPDAMAAVTWLGLKLANAAADTQRTLIRGFLQGVHEGAALLPDPVLLVDKDTCMECRLGGPRPWDTARTTEISARVARVRGTNYIMVSYTLQTAVQVPESKTIDLMTLFDRNMWLRTVDVHGADVGNARLRLQNYGNTWRFVSAESGGGQDKARIECYTLHGV